MDDNAVSLFEEMIDEDGIDGTLENLIEAVQNKADGARKNWQDPEASNGYDIIAGLLTRVLERI